jgi:hypothetical protein
MPADFQPVFAVLRSMLAEHATRLAVQDDSPTNYALVTRKPSPFPQQKGGPLYFGSVRLGKAYVSLHVFPLYINKDLLQAVTPILKKRMQGLTCFNFKTLPEPDLLHDLSHLTRTCLDDWAAKQWL